MPDTYAYKVRDRGGNLISGTLVADNEALVLQRLREQGLTPLEVGKQGRGFNIELTKKKVKLKELSVFSRQFATMINSGLPILRALAILADQTSNKELARVLGECRLDVMRACDDSVRLTNDYQLRDVIDSLVFAPALGPVQPSGNVTLAARTQLFA